MLGRGVLRWHGECWDGVFKMVSDRAGNVRVGSVMLGSIRGGY